MTDISGVTVYLVVQTIASSEFGLVRKTSAIFDTEQKARDWIRKRWDYDENQDKKDAPKECRFDIETRVINDGETWISY